MPQSWNLEWLNANAERAFPFKEDGSRQDVNALIRLPNSLIVDLVFVVPAGADYRYWLKSLMYSGTHLSLVLADEADNQPDLLRGAPHPNCAGRSIFAWRVGSAWRIHVQSGGY